MSASRTSAGIARIAALASLLAVAATACGGSDEPAATTLAPDASVSVAPPTDASSPDGTGTPSPDGTGSATSDGDGGATDPSSPATGGATTIEGAILWTSPEGTFSMEISPDWTEMNAGSAVITWSINNADAPEANVNITSSQVGQFTAQDYVDVTIASLANLGTLEVVESGVKEGANGKELGYIETKGEVTSNPGVKVHFYVTVSTGNGLATVATFSATENNYSAAINLVRPYLETLQTL